MTTDIGVRTGIEAAITELRERFWGRVETSAAVRAQHANMVSGIACEPPDAVVWPETTEEVAAIVTIAAAHRCPVIAFGAGTSLEGHVNAPLGGITLDMSRMNRVVAVNARDLDCVVEAGVTRRQLNAHLRDSGLFFPVDSGAEDATLGGMAATRASGTTSVRYGTMRDNVVNLTAVMADGSVIKTGGRARKSAAGFDLARLLIGSEGTLGIITELTLRLFPVPDSIVAAVCPFESIDGACDAVIGTIEAGLGVARIELLDAAQMRAVNLYSHLALKEVPTLFVELHGTPAATREQAEIFGKIARENGGLGIEWAEAQAERQRLWRARHDAYFAVRGAWPGKTTLVTDVCVPISRLADCIRATVEDIARSGLTAPIVGHVGDGNFHAIPVFDAADAGEAAAVRGFIRRLAERALEMDGTVTGEHGVGQGKAQFLEAEHGAGVAVMRRIKRELDPHGILNPGKVFMPGG